MIGYRAIEDPYCYAGTNVLRNKAGLRDAATLEEFETVVTALRFEEAMPSGRFTRTHYKAVHRHIFQDVYSWAGRVRSIRIEKNGSVFCYPEHIEASLTALFNDLRNNNLFRGRSTGQFVKSLAGFLTELNAIHAFRDGNGRAQLTFAALLADHAGHSLDLDKIEAMPFLQAMIESFHNNETALFDQLQHLIE